MAFRGRFFGTCMTDPTLVPVFDLPVAPSLVSQPLLPSLAEPAAPADWVLERRSDGAVLVRVPSLFRGEKALPEAVFSFRLGDPQFAYWEGELLRRSGR
jgi:hypothetical protein